MGAEPVGALGAEPALIWFLPAASGDVTLSHGTFGLMMSWLKAGELPQEPGEPRSTSCDLGPGSTLHSIFNIRANVQINKQHR